MGTVFKNGNTRPINPKNLDLERCVIWWRMHEKQGNVIYSCFQRSEVSYPSNVFFFCFNNIKIKAKICSCAVIQNIPKTCVSDFPSLSAPIFFFFLVCALWYIPIIPRNDLMYLEIT